MNVNESFKEYQARLDHEMIRRESYRRLHRQQQAEEAAKVAAREAIEARLRVNGVIEWANVDDATKEEYLSTFNVERSK